MDYSPQFEEAVRVINPNVTPEQVSMVYGKLKQQHPNAQEQEMVDAVGGAAAVRGDMDPNNLTPGAQQQYSTYTAAQQAEQGVQQKQQELAQIDQGIKASAQNIQQWQQQIASAPQEQYTGPQDLVAAQQRVADRRNPGAETIGHIIAALGGKGSQDTYNNYLKGKRADEQQEITNVKDRMSAETHAFQFQKAKEDYMQTRLDLKRKNKEDLDRNNPDSQVSIITRGMFKAMAESNPALKNIPGVDKMSAAQLSQVLPLGMKMEELAVKKVESERKARESDAKIAYDVARTSKATAETAKINQPQPDGGDGETIIVVDKSGNRTINKDAVKSFQASSANAKLASQLEAPLEEAITAAEKAPSSGLGRVVADISTVTEATKTDGARARETLDRATNQAIGLLASIDPRAKGAPSNADIQGIKNSIQSPAASPEEKVKALRTVQSWVKMMKEDHDFAYNSLNEESRNKLKTFGITSNAPTTPSAGGKTVTTDYVKQQAAKFGSTEEEVIAHLKSKGYEVR